MSKEINTIESLLNETDNTMKRLVSDGTDVYFLLKEYPSFWYSMKDNGGIRNCLKKSVKNSNNLKIKVQKIKDDLTTRVIANPIMLNRILPYEIIVVFYKPPVENSRCVMRLLNCKTLKFIDDPEYLVLNKEGWLVNSMFQLKDENEQEIQIIKSIVESYVSNFELRLFLRSFRSIFVQQNGNVYVTSSRKFNYAESKRLEYEYIMYEWLYDVCVNIFPKKMILRINTNEIRNQQIVKKVNENVRVIFIFVEKEEDIDKYLMLIQNKNEKCSIIVVRMNQTTESIRSMYSIENLVNKCKEISEKYEIKIEINKRMDIEDIFERQRMYLSSMFWYCLKESSEIK